MGERLRLDVQQRGTDALRHVAVVTVSIGIAAAAAGELRGDELVHRADKALYIAKHAGKNRVEIFA